MGTTALQTAVGLDKKERARARRGAHNSTLEVRLGRQVTLQGDNVRGTGRDAARCGECGKSCLRRKKREQRLSEQ